MIRCYYLTHFFLMIYLHLEVLTDVVSVSSAVWAPGMGLRGKNKLELLPDSRLPQNKQTLGSWARTGSSRELGPSQDNSQSPISCPSAPAR